MSASRKGLLPQHEKLIFSIGVVAGPSAARTGSMVGPRPFTYCSVTSMGNVQRTQAPNESRYLSRESLVPVDVGKQPFQDVHEQERRSIAFEPHD